VVSAGAEAGQLLGSAIAALLYFHLEQKILLVTVERLLHSEAYIRYIETLQPERVHVGGWERQLHATPESSVSETARLPSHWLAEGVADAGNVVKTLWHLRDYLMKDALGISRAYEGRL